MNATPLRENIISLICDIASPERQLQYEKTVTMANVPEELVCSWFDDFYYPDTELFKKSFTEKEMSELALFNEYYDARVSKIPCDKGVLFLQKNEAWQEVQLYAQQLLEKCDWNNIL